MFEEPDASMVKQVQTETMDPASICHSSPRVPKDQNEVQPVRHQQRIMWTRDEMLAIAPECKSLPEGLGVIPEHLSSLFDVGPPAALKARGKGRVGVSGETGGRKRGEDSVRPAEQPSSVWRKKDRVTGEASERTERHGVKSRAVAEPAWRPRRETHDDGVWNTPSPNKVGAADGWLMPDADEQYELGGNSNNVEAFEVMRQQARAEWAQSQNFKPVQDSATEDLMNDLLADAENDSKGNPGVPPGLEGLPALRQGPPASQAPKKIDIQMLFNDIPPPPGLNRLASPDHDSAEKRTTAYVPPENEMRSMLRTGPGLGSNDVAAHGSQAGTDLRAQMPVPVEGLDQAAERSSLAISSQPGSGVDVGLLNDGGADDAAPGSSLEDMPMSQGMPRASSPPSSSPRGSIWGPGLDAGAGSTITSTDWSQMQEIWNREPASKSPEAAAMQRLNDEFNNERLSGTASTSMAGMTQARALLSDAMVYGRHPDILGGPAFAANQAPQSRVAVSDSMMALASMSLLPVQSTGADKQLHQDNRQVQSIAGHGTHVQHDYNSVNMVRRQQQPVQQRPAHVHPQHRGAAEDPHSFELYLKQLVANAQQQQQVGDQRVQGAASSRAAHATSVIQPRTNSFAHAAAVTQQASLEHIRKLAPLQLASTAVPQQRQVSHMSTARQLQPQASNAYSQHQEGHRMQDPTWMLRQLKGSGHPQAHVASASVGNLAMQQAWATPTRMQAQYPSSTYDRRGHQATMQQYGAAAHTARVGLQQTNATLQGMYADQLARAALQSAARQPQQQSGLWVPQATSQHHQHNAYAAQVRPAHVQGLQQAMNRGGHYAVQSSLPRYYPDNTQPGYTALYRQ